MSQFLIFTAAFALTLAPLLLGLIRKNSKRMKKIALFGNILSVAALVLIVTFTAFTGTASAAGTADAAETTASSDGLAAGLAYIGAGLAVFGSCIGGGIAVASAASAALGAISENEGLFGKSLIMVVLAEGIAIYGMLISVLIIGNI